ncbi:AMP-dependent synthetase [Microbulbifer flavimaris]|uniref:AMP-dependent synthetase n=1 Tax=Microbulbifer flavimaris TaxID=1781068 RepID=A0ABX4I1P0_9GAMM|nr:MULTISPECIES: long-chain fatty acid--CoA ligase [Microbulbifer]KUJ83773.1 AMP-dependent synthetase [Microbulbifer sp. ZGT114]PCO05948.1 AMP-dependent synthetase [Microbulbifer flavimaris]
MEMFDLLAQRARVTPDRPALEDLDSGECYDYRQLNERAARLAAAAREHWGLQEGDRLAYLGHSRAEFFAMLFGCAKAGLILVPLNWRLAQPELEVLLDDCDPRALIFGGEFAEVAASLGKRWDTITLVALDGVGAGQRDYHSDLANSSPDLNPHAEKNPDTPWYLLYTSGTTGRPKGVIQTFRMMLANHLNVGLAVNLTGDDVLLNVLPLFHTAGINLYSSAVFLVGGCVLVSRSFNPDQALQVLQDRATIFFGVPAVYRALLDHPRFDGARLKRVRSWGCGGAPLSLPVAKRYADEGIRVRTGMGMTETGPTVFLLDEELVIDKIGSVGRPQLLTEVRIVDRHGRDVPDGEPGELLIRGPNVTPGYWNRPDATAEAIRADGWLHSGDVARCDEDGCYYIVDRWKDMYISGGENVYPAEVEQVLEQHPAIAEVAVVGMPDERWGEVGKAYFGVKSGAQAPVDDELRAFCRARLAGYKVPKAFEALTALPRNALGKVIKQELRDDAAGH